MAISFVITSACPYTFGSVYWVLSMRRIHRTPHFAHVFLLSVFSIAHSSVRLSCTDHLSVYSVFSFFQYVINWSLHSVSSEFSISCSDYYTCFCACSVMFLFQLYSILHAQYLSSTDAYMCYLFSGCRFRFLASRSCIDRYSIFSSADSRISPHSTKTIVICLFFSI